MKILACGRRGTSLLEMIIIMAALAIAVMIGTTTILAALRTERSAAESLLRLHREAALIDLFRADVATAKTAPTNVGEVEAGLSCLLLSREDGRFVVYRWSDGQLERTVDAEVAPAVRPRIPLGSDIAAVEFTRPTPHTVEMRLVPQQHTKPATTIVAALGGDLR
jgi:Tfp pilus assembly protein FimT